MAKQITLDKWRDAAQKWEARRIAKRLTAWEACGLELWTALNGATVKMHAQELALGDIKDAATATIALNREIDLEWVLEQIEMTQTMRRGSKSTVD